jgi:hypothetical protein
MHGDTGGGVGGGFVGSEGFGEEVLYIARGPHLYYCRLNWFHAAPHPYPRCHKQVCRPSLLLSESSFSLCGKRPILFCCLLRVIGSKPLLPRYKTRNVHLSLSLSSFCVTGPRFSAVVLICSNSHSPAITAGMSTFLTYL